MTVRDFEKFFAQLEAKLLKLQLTKIANQEGKLTITRYYQKRHRVRAYEVRGHYYYRTSKTK
jgi:hypothetical protein